MFSADDFIQKLVPTIEGLTEAWESRPSPRKAADGNAAGPNAGPAQEELTLSPVNLEPVVDPASADTGVRPPAPTKQCLIMEQPIVCESHLGIAQIVHNQSLLGFFRERGGISY